MFRFWFDTAMLMAESQEVVALRLVTLAQGGRRAEREARRMVLEKIDAAAEAGWSLAGGAHPETIVGTYRRHVAANRRRLTGG